MNVELKPERYVGGPSVTVHCKASELDWVSRGDIKRIGAELLALFTRRDNAKGDASK